MKYFRLALCTLLASLASAQRTGTYDPTRDRDPDSGRIPKGTRPADLPNPDRWRYSPETLLKDGDIFDRFLLTTFISPLIFREEDIGFGGGFALTDVNFRSQRFREFANIVVSYSEEGQQAYGVTWRRWLNHREVEGGGILRDERSTLTLRASYTRTLTRRFFGLGSRTSEFDESSYTEELATFGGDLRMSIPEPGSDLLLNLGATVEHHQLSGGRVSNVPRTDVSFPALFADADNQDLLWLRAGVAYDTRDSIAQPYSGGRIGIGVAAAPFQTGGDAGMILGADASYALTVPPLLHNGGDPDEENPPTDVIAVGAFIQTTEGDVPFYSLPSLGGDDTLRGFIQNRFTGETAAHGSIEYRLTTVPRGVTLWKDVRIERFYVALFYDLGTVEQDLGDLSDARWHDSYGVGLRMAFNREAVFRVDFGFSDEDSVVTIAFGQTF